MVNLEDIFFHKGVMISDPSLSSLFLVWLSVKGLILNGTFGKIRGGYIQNKWVANKPHAKEGQN